MNNMNDSEYERLLAESWRRALTPEETARLQAFLTSQPERAEEWADEVALNEALDRLPQAPVSSNFTALVMQAVERDSAREPAAFNQGRTWLGRWLRRPASGLAWAALLMLTLWLGFQQFHTQPKTEQARNLAVILQAVAPEPGVFEDFDAIQRMPRADDEELYAVLNVSQ